MIGRPDALTGPASFPESQKDRCSNAHKFMLSQSDHFVNLVLRFFVCFCRLYDCFNDCFISLIIYMFIFMFI